MNRQYRLFVPVVLLVALVTVDGCKKKSLAPPVATAPPMTIPTPTAKISASPTSVSAGDKVVLTWRTTDADSVSIEGIGSVPSSGVKTVTPPASTTYRLVARGTGGTAEADAGVTVNQPSPVMTAAGAMSSEEEFRKNMHDIFFDYDKSDLRDDTQLTLAQDASYLVSHSDLKIVIGGYCDERGSNEYNLALGENRAESVEKALLNAGVASTRIRVVSYGKEKPFCIESTESCRQQNRRAGFSLDR